MNVALVTKDGVLGNSFLYRAARILEEADFEL